jgi:hypothetical protein
VVHFLSNDLARWDALAGGDGAAAGGEKSPGPPPEALVLSLFTDERPLRGAAGLADWRLAGRLSRLVKADRLSGRRNEVVMTPPARARLPFARLMLFGLGEQAGFDEGRYAAAVRRIRSVLERAGIRRYAVQPPGRATGLIAPRRALELWIETAKQDGLEHEVTVIESPSGQKEMQEALRGRRG